MRTCAPTLIALIARIQRRLCGAVGGRRDEHDALVTQAALALAARVDRLVLAQASLAHLAQPLAQPLAQKTGKPVLASPEWMVADVLARVAAAA